MNTKGILFICGGACDGIEKRIAQRVNRQTIGFSAAGQPDIDSDSLLQYINATDIKNFGLIPELVGRFPVLSYLEPLDPFALKRILTEPKNALIKQYQKLVRTNDDVELEFTKESLVSIAKEAIKIFVHSLQSN